MSFIESRPVLNALRRRSQALASAFAASSLLLVSCSGAASESSPSEVDPVASEAMPVLVGQRLDVAISDLTSLGFSKGDIEVVGGGALGIVDESRWEVCEQRPDAGSSTRSGVRLIVDRECPDEASEPAEATSEKSPESVESAVEIESAPDSPSVFIASVRRDLRDMRKDLKDLEDAFNEGGLIRVAGNQLELSFNLGQLEARVAPPAFAPRWRKRLEALDAAVENIGTQLGDEGSPKSLRQAVDAARAEVKGGLAELKDFEKSLED